MFYVAPMHGQPLPDERRRTLSVVTGLLGLALLACVSSTIEARGRSAYAPANEHRGGSLRYFEGTKSRDEAYREMFTFCGGAYEIVGERDVGRGTTTNYNRYGYGSTTTTMIEHVIDFRCVEQGSRGPAVRLSGDEWRLSRDYVIAQSGCASANVEHEVASPTPGAKGYAVSACGQRWLCSAGNGVAACAVDGAGGVQPIPSTPGPAAPPPTGSGELVPVPAL